MVSGIVEQHQGWIHVDSEPGRGTTFRLGFPRIEPAGVESAEQFRSLPRGGKETILLVEDEEGVRRVATRILEEAGYRTLVARNGAEAVELFKGAAENVSLVVLDLMMPVMGGAEARDEIRKIDREVRFLFSTGYSKTVFPSAALRHTPVLAKPYSRAALLQKVREVLDE